MVYILRHVLEELRAFSYSHQTFIKLFLMKALLRPYEEEVYRQKVRTSLRRGFTYAEATLWQEAKLKSGIRLPHKFWHSAQTAKNFIYLVLDAIPGFKTARERNDIKVMADLYRRHVIGFKVKDRKKYKNGQQGFFYENGLRGLMANPRDYLGKEGSASSLLRFALPGLIDAYNPNALHPCEVEIYYWTDAENARQHILIALDTIPGFKNARLENNIHDMARLYREHVIKYKVKDKVRYKDGQRGFFDEVGGLSGLMSLPRKYLGDNKIASVAPLLRFVLPQLVDANNPQALNPRELEHFYWDEKNAKHHILLALDTVPGFKEARERSDIKTMAELYRRHVMGYRSIDKRHSNGQTGFFSELGGLRGIMCYPKEFLDKENSPAALLRFALPELVDSNNLNALTQKEIGNLYWQNSRKVSK